MIPGFERHRDHMSANLLVHFLGGGLAGITAASTTYPLDLVRTRLAAQVRSYDLQLLVNNYLLQLILYDG